MRPKVIAKRKSAVQDPANFETLEEFRGIFEEEEEAYKQSNPNDGKPTSEDEGGGADWNSSAKTLPTVDQDSSTQQGRLNTQNEKMPEFLPEKVRTVQTQFRNIGHRPLPRTLHLNDALPKFPHSAFLLTLPDHVPSPQNCYMMNGANPDAASHLSQPLTFQNDSTDCDDEDNTVLEHMPNALLPIRGFAHHFSPQFDPHDFFPPGFFTTYRGLKQALDVVRREINDGQGLLRDQVLYNEIGARGGTIAPGKGEHATELDSFFNDEERDPGFWEELKKDWQEGPWADWLVDEKGNEFVPDPRRA